MILLSIVANLLHCGILHVCGDDPVQFRLELLLKQYSPRMWRWSQATYEVECWKRVFSTYVEMILFLVNSILHTVGILHVCGDDPYFHKGDAVQVQYSPRMWRWSLWYCSLLARIRVFSTYVEMILFLCEPWWSFYCILHVCGDDPNLKYQDLTSAEYSPRMWRWSLALEW